MNSRILFIVAMFTFVTTSAARKYETLCHHQRVIKPLQHHQRVIKPLKKATPSKTNKVEVDKTDTQVS